MNIGNSLTINRSEGSINLTLSESVALEQVQKVFTRHARTLRASSTLEDIVRVHTVSPHSAASFPVSYLWAVNMCIFADATPNRQVWLEWLGQSNPFKQTIATLCREFHCDDSFVWATALVQAYKDRLWDVNHVQAALLEMQSKSLEGAICGFLQLAAFYKAEDVRNKDLHARLNSMLAQLEDASWQEVEWLLPARSPIVEVEVLYEALCGLDIVFKWAQTNKRGLDEQVMRALGEALCELHVSSTALVSEECRAIVKRLLPHFQEVLPDVKYKLICEFFLKSQEREMR